MVYSFCFYLFIYFSLALFETKDISYDLRDSSQDLTSTKSLTTNIWQNKIQVL